MTLQDVKMTLQSHILKAARILGCTAFCTHGGCIQAAVEAELDSKFLVGDKGSLLGIMIMAVRIMQNITDKLGMGLGTRSQPVE